jgi:hypothetical protein
MSWVFWILVFGKIGCGVVWKRYAPKWKGEGCGIFEGIDEILLVCLQDHPEEVGVKVFP